MLWESVRNVQVIEASQKSGKVLKNLFVCDEIMTTTTTARTKLKTT